MLRKQQKWDSDMCIVYRLSEGVIYDRMQNRGKENLSIFGVINFEVSSITFNC
jgi:hypothetical protein